LPPSSIPSSRGAPFRAEATREPGSPTPTPSSVCRRRRCCCRWDTPLTFPLLGLTVRLTGNPVSGVLAFVAILELLVGISAYPLARAALSDRSLAYAFEGLVLLEPGFMRLLFFGAYPYLPGVACLGLAIGFAARFVRTGRSNLLVPFWGAAAATVLAHSLSALTLGIWLALFALALLVARRFPRAVLASRPGQVGLLLFGSVVGSYYLAGQALGLEHPSYAAPVSGSSPDVARVIRPFGVTALPHAVGIPFVLTSESAFAILLGSLAAVVSGTLALVAMRGPKRFPVGLAAAALWGAASAAIGAAGYALGLETDYTRLAFGLYPPLLFGAVLLADRALSLVRDGRSRGGRSAPSPRVPRASSRRCSPLSVGATLATATALLLVGTCATYPAFVAYESQYTASAHDADFVQAVRALERSGVAGGVLTDSVQDEKWILALTARDAYVEYHRGEFEATPTEVQREQLAYYALTSSYAATDGRLVARVPGLAPNDFAGAPVLGLYVEGVPEDLFAVNPNDLTVVWAGSNEPVPVYTPGLTRVSVTFADPAVPALTVQMTDPGLVVLASVTLYPGTPNAFVTISARAAGSMPLFGVRALLTPPSASSATVSADGPDGFLWRSVSSVGRPGSVGTAAPPATVRVENASGNRPAAAVFSVSASAASGQRELSIGFSLVSPSATGGGPTLSLTMTATGLWRLWGVRFAFFAIDGASAVEERFLCSEFGAVPEYSNAQYSVLLLPAS
jgi:hypothetical protein